jgi:ribosome-associated protein
MDLIFIKTDYITLGQFLKYLGIIGSGSEAKNFLQNNDVFVNNIEEKRRGKKLYPQDLVKIFNKTYEISNQDEN